MFTRQLRLSPQENFYWVPLIFLGVTTRSATGPNKVGLLNTYFIKSKRLSADALALSTLPLSMIKMLCICQIIYYYEQATMYGYNM